MRISLHDLARALNGKVQGDHVRAPGPGHSAKDTSLSIKLADTAQGFICYAHSPRDDQQSARAYIIERLRASIPGYDFEPLPYNGVSLPAPRRRPSQPLNGAVVARMLATMAKSPPTKLIAVYDYTEIDGTLIYQVCRFEPKTFKHRLPDGNGGWLWKGSERRVIYRWPDITKHPNDPVFVCEGEKDADNVAALGLCATTVASGKWADECVQALAGRNLYIIEDADDAGRAKSREAAELLHTAAASVKIVSLPGLDGTTDNKDVSDWLRDHTKAALVKSCTNAPYWETEWISF